MRGDHVRQFYLWSSDKKIAPTPAPDEDNEQPHKNEDEDKYESSGDEPEVYEEADVDGEEQHIILHKISQEEFEDGEDDMKDCTIDEKEGEWMGKKGLQC